MVFVNWKTVYFKYNRALITAWVLVFAVCAINFNIFITFGDVQNINGTQVTKCRNRNTGDLPFSSLMTNWSIVKKISFLLTKSLN